MIDEIQSKIDLCQEQIDNLEYSGHFTDKEIEEQSEPIKSKLALLKTVKQFRILSEVAKTAANIINEFIEATEKDEMPPHIKYGMTLESYEEGLKNHEDFIKGLQNIKVNKPEILTPNQQEA